ncbi:MULTISPECIES: DUF6155 family protein [Enterococcus]|uniref:Uncharacterized protein n=1 Tax=Candidatus Enterococcus ferrettii TaxID=2815324 RepID=A0ABV0EM54_9ENTE|nr:DUF6155 family protein [Enterococcus sp. 665A]MBO1341455.1 hypothetical protein [Enterococcus sp. 665A]
MKPWTIPQLKKHLKTMDEKQLQQLVVDLYKQSKEVKEIINVAYREEDYEKGIAEEYKEKIYRIFFPKSMSAGFSLPEAKVLLKKGLGICRQPENRIDLQLFFVECGVEFTNMYGDISETFYSAIISVYDKAVTGINKNQKSQAHPGFIKRCMAIYSDSEWMAWGFGEAMVAISFELDGFSDE